MVQTRSQSKEASRPEKSKSPAKSNASGAQPKRTPVTPSPSAYMRYRTNPSVEEASTDRSNNTSEIPASLSPAVPRPTPHPLPNPPGYVPPTDPFGFKPLESRPNALRSANHLSLLNRFHSAKDNTNAPPLEHNSHVFPGLRYAQARRRRSVNSPLARYPLIHQRTFSGSSRVAIQSPPPAHKRGSFWTYPNITARQTAGDVGGEAERFEIEESRNVRGGRWAPPAARDGGVQPRYGDGAGDLGGSGTGNAFETGNRAGLGNGQPVGLWYPVRRPSIWSPTSSSGEAEDEDESGEVGDVDMGMERDGDDAAFMDEDQEIVDLTGSTPPSGNRGEGYGQARGGNHAGDDEDEDEDEDMKDEDTGVEAEDVNEIIIRNLRRENANLRRENARLTREVGLWANENNEMMDDNIEVETEAMQLREERDRLREQLAAAQCPCMPGCPCAKQQKVEDGEQPGPQGRQAGYRDRRSPGNRRSRQRSGRRSGSPVQSIEPHNRTGQQTWTRHVPNEVGSNNPLTRPSDSNGARPADPVPGSSFTLDGKVYHMAGGCLRCTTDP